VIKASLDMLELASVGYPEFDLRPIAKGISRR
jgi:hypothetical protein